MKKCVLFGAGAEGYDYDLPTGKEFSNITLGIEKTDIYDVVAKYYGERFKGDTWYPPYKKFAFTDHELTISALKKEILAEGKRYCKKSDFDAELNNRYNSMTEKQRKKTVNQYANPMGVLDNCFPAFIYPFAFGPNKFWQIVSAYTRAYLFVLSKLLKVNDNKSLLNLLEDPVGATELVLEECRKRKELDNNTYYQILRKASDSDVTVVTTNYTPLAEIIGEKETAYFNGRIGLFESPRELSVRDLRNATNKKNDSSKELYIPFIFLPSATKPIIHKIQIDEINKAYANMSDSNIIIMVGYGMNYDDNHINAMIREHIRNNKKVVILTKDDDMRKGKEYYYRLLQCNKNAPIDLKSSPDVDVLKKEFRKLLNE